MSLDPTTLSEDVREFLRERHLATLTTLRADGSPHVVAVGFTWDNDARLVRVITDGGSQKVRNAERQRSVGAGGADQPSALAQPAGRRAAVSQVDGRRWLTLEGEVRVERGPAEVAEAVRRYVERYRQPRLNPHRVALIIAVDRVLGRT